MRSNSKTKSIWVSLCRFLVYIILIFAVIASGIIVYYSLSRNSFIDLLYLILTFLFPVLLSAIPMSVYIACCRSKLSNRLHETIADCVSATTQTYVDSLKKQGKFDAEA